MEIRAYVGAEVWEFAGLFFLKNSKHKFDINGIGLYRDNGLLYSKMLTSRKQIKYVKQFYQLLKAWRISLEANCIGKSVNYLDITLHLQKNQFISTQNLVALKLFSINSLHQSKLDYLTFSSMLKFSMKHLKTVITP